MSGTPKRRINIADRVYILDFGTTLWAVAGEDIDTDVELLTAPNTHCFAEASRARKSEGATVTGWWCRSGDNTFQIGRNKAEAIEQMVEIARQEGSKWL